MLVLLTVMRGPLAAQVSLDPATDSQDIGAAMAFAPDAGQSLAVQLAQFRAGAYTTNFDVATTNITPYQFIWGVVDVTNSAAQDWVLTSQVFGIVALQVYVIRADGLTQEVLNYSARGPFMPSHFAGTRLRSATFQLDQDETVTLMVKMSHGPVSEAAFRLETPPDMAARSFRAAIFVTAFYAFSLSSLIFFFGFVASMRSASGIGYASLLFISLGFLAFSDGFLFRFVYPSHPALHLPVGIAILLAFSGVGFWVAGLSVQENGQHQKVARLLKSLTLVSLAALALVNAVPPEIMANVAYLLSALMFAANLIASLFWTGLTTQGTLLVRGIFAALTFATVVFLSLLFTGGLGGILDPGVILKAVFAVSAAWIIATNTRALLELRRNHESALEREVTSLRREASADRERQHLQESYTKVRDLAAMRQKQLATASHDIRQPLTSLRMTMDALSVDQDPAFRAQLNDAFDYMEGLSSDYLADTVPEPAQEEAYDLSLVFQTAGQMFQQEASSKGTDFRIVVTSVKTDVPLMALMRIINNLVSNAIKHTDGGKVLLGLRRPNTIMICDQGCGMTATQIAMFRQAYQKGAESDGTGLGLPICFELAATHDLELSVTSTPNRGTVFSLTLNCMAAQDNP